MGQSTLDPEWQQLQNRIENLFGHLLKPDMQGIEHKSKFVTPPLETPPAYTGGKNMHMK